MSALKDLTGQRFGRLVVIQREGTSKHGATTWLCQCDCGKTCVEPMYWLTTGKVKSCGCLSSEITRAIFTTHGKRKSRLYGVWANMKNRCYNTQIRNYHRYGGRGITVCDEWRNDFKVFYDWAMANGYDENAPYKAACNSVVTRQEGISLEESFATVTAVAAFAQMQEGISGHWNILNNLCSIVVDAICHNPTAGTDVVFTGQFNVNVELI